MNKNYDKTYLEIENVFGIEPESILLKYINQLDKNYPILDVGAGQGRNSFFLANEGFEIEAIDTSKVSIDIIKKFAKANNLNIKTYKSDFLDYEVSNKKYSAVLIFGLFQILSWHSIIEFIKKSKKIVKKGGLIFITAFGTEDFSYKNNMKDFIEIGKNSFFNDEKHIRTFLESDEILSFFEDTEILHHKEGLGKEHKHGNGPIEQHLLVELVAKVK